MEFAIVSALPDGLGIFKPKIPIWVKFGGPWNGKCYIWYNLWPFCIAYGPLIYLPVLVCLDQEQSGNSALNAFPTYNTYLMQQRRPHFFNFGETLQFKSAF
jgi:hypothetical protein